MSGPLGIPVGGNLTLIEAAASCPKARPDSAIR